MTKPTPEDDDEWETTFVAETRGLSGGIVMRDGVGYTVSEAEALQWAIDFAKDAAGVAEVVDACIFGLTLPLVDVKVTALRGIATLARRGMEFPRRDALVSSIRAALTNSDEVVREAALEAARALELS